MTKQDFTLTGTGFKGFPEGGLGSEGAAGAWERAFAEAGLPERFEGLREDAEAGIGGLPDEDGDLLQGMGISIGEAEIDKMPGRRGCCVTGSWPCRGARAEGGI